MGKLSSLKVDRVDGVDKPAIRKRWVMVKSEDGATTEVEKDYAGAARNVVEALVKEEGVEFSDETVEVLRALVELLELEGVEFAAKSEESDESENDDEGESDESDDEGENDESDDDEPEAAAADDVEKNYSADEVEELIAKALRVNGVSVESVTKGEVGKIQPKSRQPKAQDEPTGSKQVKKGEGLFRNVVFADATKLGS